MHLFNVALFLCTLFCSPSPAVEVFVGTTPCGQLIRPQLQIDREKDCALVEWHLTLLHDPATDAPGAYRLATYSHHILTDNSYSRPGVKRETSGQWRLVQGTGPHARYMVYELNPGKPGATLRFVKLADHIVHLIDGEGRFVNGDPFFSYTLHRKMNHHAD